VRASDINFARVAPFKYATPESQGVVN